MRHAYVSCFSALAAIATLSSCDGGPSLSTERKVIKLNVLALSIPKNDMLRRGIERSPDGTEQITGAILVVEYPTFGGATVENQKRWSNYFSHDSENMILIDLGAHTPSPGQVEERLFPTASRGTPAEMGLLQKSESNPDWEDFFSDQSNPHFVAQCTTKSVDIDGNDSRYCRAYLSVSGQVPVMLQFSRQLLKEWRPLIEGISGVLESFVVGRPDHN